MQVSSTKISNKTLERNLSNTSKQHINIIEMNDEQSRDITPKHQKKQQYEEDEQEQPFYVKCCVRCNRSVKFRQNSAGKPKRNRSAKKARQKSKKRDEGPNFAAEQIAPIINSMDSYTQVEDDLAAMIDKQNQITRMDAYTQSS